MTEEETKLFMMGRRSALLRVMQECARELGIKDPMAKLAVLLDEQERMRSELRKVCEVLGSNDWPDSADLGDVVEKSVLKYLLESDDE